jgi:hypothetical protein
MHINVLLGMMDDYAWTLKINVILFLWLNGCNIK